MSEGAIRHPVQIDKFFAGPGARGDQWRNLVELAEAWKSGLIGQSSTLRSPSER
jgi:hypothetical protein